MKCLVTGGAGFIGSHLCDRLLAQNHEVICVDSFITGSRSNIEHLHGHPQFTFIEHDCVQTLPQDLRAQVIYHFASPASPPKYQKYPVETILTNTLGTYLLLEKARRMKSRLIYASTSEVYGDPLEHPQKETYFGNVNPNGPRSCYDEGKRAGESLVMTYFRKYGVSTMILRIFNTYGPRMDLDDGRVVTNFIRQIFAGEPLTINGDGGQTRSFCYITDIIDAVMALTNAKRTQGEVFNIGSDKEVSIIELADMLIKITEYKGEIITKPLPQDDPKRRRPDLTKIMKFTGWRPKVTETAGLKETLKYLSRFR